MRSLLLFAVSTQVQASAFVRARAGGPIEKVVGRIRELRACLEGDEEAEQKIYNKYACWGATIDKEVERLGNKVMELKGAVATLAAEIAELTKDIAENEAAQAEATALR